MAKETKAEREVRMAAEQMAEWATFVDAYPTRFAALMFNYMNTPGFTVKKLDAETYEFNRPDHLWREYQLKVTPAVNWSSATVDAMDTLERSLAHYAAEQAEYRRRETVRKNALNKLDREERELLGL